MPTHREWAEIQEKARAIVAQKGEPFDVGKVVRRDIRRRLLWISGFGQEPVPMIDFDGDINVYDEWREYDLVRTKVTATGAGTFHPNPATDFMFVEGVGGGGGAAGCTDTKGGQAGGGAGYCRKKLVRPAVTLVDPNGWPTAGYSYSVGAGGAAGAAASNGSAGGNTTFGTGPVFTASGGDRGRTDSTGGFGGAATGGDLNIEGGDGGTSVYVIVAGVLTPGNGALGGSSRLGGGGKGGVQAAGQAGNLYGGGGGGGGKADGGSDFAGGAGAAGILIFEETQVTHIVQKKYISATPRVPEVGELVLVMHMLGSKELPFCVGSLKSYGFSQFDPGLE